MLKTYHLSPFLGKSYAKIKYQNMTPDGIPRFAKMISIRDISFD